MRQKTHHQSWVAAGLIVLTASLCVLPESALAESDPCYGLTYEGNCDGDIAQWCENGEVIQVDCTDQGMVCAWNDEKNYYGCSHYVDEGDTCDLPESGLCHSDVAVAWCHDNGETVVLECGAGTICGWNDEENYFDCIPEEEMQEMGSEEIEPNQREDEAVEEDWTEEHAQNHEEDPVVEAETVRTGTTEVFDFEEPPPQKTDSNDSLSSTPIPEPTSEGCRTNGQPLATGLIFLIFACLWCRGRLEGSGPIP